MGVKFTYGESSIKDLKVTTKKNSRGKILSSTVFINDEPLIGTKRFWKAWKMRFKLNDTVFKYYSPDEVFKRISDTVPNDKVRYCIERTTNAEGVELPARALAVTNPATALVKYNTLAELLTENENVETDAKTGKKILAYSEGMIRSRHLPKYNDPFSIMGDTMENRFVIDTPIDGYGRPQVYVSLLRLVCQNGAIGFAPAFRSELSFGKKNDSIDFALQRALDNFNNPEGYQAIRSRFESSATSWASVYEAMALHKTVVKLYQNKEFRKSVGKLVIGSESKHNNFDGAGIMQKFVQVTGNLNQHYGIANISAMSDKKQKTVPAKCKVYDLLNLASELATHHATPAGARKLQGYVGELLADEYDLEGTGEKYEDFTDIFIERGASAETMAELT